MSTDQKKLSLFMRLCAHLQGPSTLVYVRNGKATYTHTGRETKFITKLFKKANIRITYRKK
jgi:hypothetical protein